MNEDIRRAIFLFAGCVPDKERTSKSCSRGSFNSSIITELMEEAHEKGTPPMRPLFYESKKPIDTGRHYLVIDRFAFGRSADNACALDPFNEVPLHKEINKDKRQDSQQNACILHHAQIERI